MRVSRAAMTEQVNNRDSIINRSVSVRAHVHKLQFYMWTEQFKNKIHITLKSRDKNV